MHAIEQIGAVAGLASFLGLALLAFLYFAQARHVRDLEEKASFIPDELDLPTAATAAKPAARATAAAPAGAAAKPAGKGKGKDKGKPAAPAPPPQTEAQAARQVEIARAKAERRQRFEQRRRTPGGRAAPAAAANGRRMPEPRAMIVIGLGVAVLVAGIVFGAGKLLSSNNSSSGGSGSSAQSSGQSTGAPPVIAVLNGTSTAGLAATVGQTARGAGFKLGVVSNTQSPFAVTTVMFAPGGQKTAADVAQKLNISQVQPMTGEVKKIAGGASVALVVGKDRAGG